LELLLINNPKSYKKITTILLVYYRIVRLMTMGDLSYVWNEYKYFKQDTTIL